ncbi:MAG: FAD-dependent monooxygenase [Chloroflexi bacterium]|nr:MAG: FAD-dependent monooxygenase [Chloroflexota bacterium]
MPDYDIITVGGGLGGAAIAKAMAERGAQVLVVEREAKFKDRVRGEWLAPWGVAEARELGVYETLISDGGYHAAGWDTRLAGNSIGIRDLAATTTPAVHPMTFFHPRAQQALLEAAEKAGAKVRNGARVVGVQPGATPSVTLESNGRSESLTARMIVGADGRGSMVRKWGGFESKEDPDQQWLAGILIENTAAPMDYSVAVFNPFASRIALMFPQGDGRARFYFGARSSEPGMSGDREVPRFIQESVKTGMPAEYFEGASPAGALATFSGADSWVDHPYLDGVVLIGDAAAQSDQTWGQGMALTLRDARILRDALAADDDWNAAGHAYAESHDRQFLDLHTAESWSTAIFMEPGPEADARRAKALPQLAMDQTRVPDIFFSGPGSAPVDEAARRRFFGEE